MKILFTVCITFSLLFSSQGYSQNSNRSNDRPSSLKHFAKADSNKDGKVTAVEKMTFMLQQLSKVVQNPTVFVPSADDVTAAINGGQTRSFLKLTDGGLRLAMSGHSWVSPGVRTLPPLAKAAGYISHHQVAHISGGASGSANSIWLKEFGKWQQGLAAEPILIPAISTGKWDIMSWGPYPGDKPVYYQQWIDFCLANNPAMNFLIQDGWPWYKSTYEEMKPREVATQIIKEQSMMQKEIFLPMYSKLQKKYPGQIQMIPISTALVNLMKQFAEGKIPHLTCIDEAKRKGQTGFYLDGGHLSRTSGIEHLVGYAYFSMLYKRSPETVKGYIPKGVPPAFDLQMRKAIWKAVIQNSMTHIEDRDGDGYAD